MALFLEGGPFFQGIRERTLPSSQDGAVGAYKRSEHNLDRIMGEKHSGTPESGGTDFIRKRIIEDNETGKYDGRVVTRFPPEPNGYLHIGHAKSIVLNFGVAEEFGGITHLRFDDTNPLTEETSYVESIQRDVKWLGYDWGNRLHFASDYFPRLYEFATQLVKQGQAYVCELSEEEIREYRGTVKQPGRPSPWRERSVEENLDLLERMRQGEFPDGSRTLRARIDMANPNMKMRDPLIYRIRHATHHRTGDEWCIYPMYDFAHCLSDYIEGITHSICTLEFENNRELYDWFIQQVTTPPQPQQIEFARLNLSYTVMSKRKLLEMVRAGTVNGWDDPRMPTISGLRRRGVQPEAIRAFCERIGVAKTNSTVEYQQLEHAIREDLNLRAPRRMAVLDPLKVVIENFPEGHVEWLDAVNNPEDPEAGTRQVPFGKVLYIEQDDFMEDPPRKFFRLAPGREVRLRYAFFITCTEVIKDDAGEVKELRCTYDPETRGGDAPDGRKVKATLHWVSAEHAVKAEVRLYDYLFTDPNPLGNKEVDFKDTINKDSLQVMPESRLEPDLGEHEAGWFCQFERKGYFCMDPDSTPESPVYNRTATLRDTWAKLLKQQGKG